jgi:hypothetical protein
MLKTKTNDKSKNKNKSKKQANIIWKLNIAQTIKKCSNLLSFMRMVGGPKETGNHLKNNY